MNEILFIVAYKVGEIHEMKTKDAERVVVFEDLNKKREKWKNFNLE